MSYVDSAIMYHAEERPRQAALFVFGVPVKDGGEMPYSDHVLVGTRGSGRSRGEGQPPPRPARLIWYSEGELMPSDKYYHSARHKAWRAAVLKRAGYLCEECKRYGRLDSDGLPVKATTAHHILHRDEHPEAQYLVSNGRALCEACHMKAHPEKHGRGTTEKDYG